MDKYPFRGLETNGFLLKGKISYQKALELAGDAFKFSQASSPDHVRCALLVVRIEHLSTWGIPLIRWTYPEAVWLLELSDGSYLAVKAHTPLYMLGALSLMDKYNTDIGSMSLLKLEGSASISVGSKNTKFSAELNGIVEGDTELIKNLWTRSSNGEYYRIPWGDNKPANVFRMSCQIAEGSLGEQVFGAGVIWEDEAIYFIDRPHRCAPAYSESPLVLDHGL